VACRFRRAIRRETGGKGIRCGGTLRYVERRTTDVRDPDALRAGPARARVDLTVDTYGHLVPGANGKQWIDRMTYRKRPSATQPQPKTRRALRSEP
jgi:hypothetical protein